MSIDKYDPIRVLGEGSFGKVYLMRDKVRRTFVCVKVIKIKNIPKKEREATKMEVDLLRRLHHPNIVRYIDSFLSKNNESLCICMEYCDGGDLASQIKAARRNLFSESKILHWFVQLALGLHYMHTNKVLHRDLKTQNVFMLGNGRLVLGDLGISKVLDGTMDFAQTCIGTPYYMSPEIFQNKPYSYKSDVWALGCVLYEMTTLNHAFDANSLNGLAGKIVKGRYPPIHHKYSKFLRDLIAQMLLINPQQRPDLDQILRKPFIKKHIVNFFADIAARPSVGLGEGTMIVRAAAGAPINGVFSNDTNMLSLQKQLHVLDMTDAVQEALAPRDVPVDSLEAKKLVKEQAGALRREKEHKLMVESALEKLRLERESRTRQRSNPGVGSAVSPVPSAAAAVSYRVAGDPKGGAPLPSARREDPMRPAAARQPQSVRRPSDGPFQPSVEAARKEVRDRFALGGGVGAGARSSDQDKEKLKRNPSVTEERRILDERKRIEQEEKRKDDVRYEARIREEARLREDSRARGEAAAKQKLDQLRAQVDAVARRDQQREKERMRQKEEIEQLKRDKVELDRRSNERDRLREERREEERKKLEDGRKQQLDFMQEKSVPYSRDSSEYRAGQRADEKDPGSSVSAIAREKALLVQRRDTQARDKVDRADALRAVRVAEEDSRRARAIANNKMYPDSANYPGLGAPMGERGEERSKRAGERDTTMSVEELTQRLNDVNKGRNTRYDGPQAGSSAQRSASMEGTGYSSDDTASEDEGEMWNDRRTSDQGEDEEEDMRKRENELKQELNMATLRCEELKRTMIETKSFIDPLHSGMPKRGPSDAGLRRSSGMQKPAVETVTAVDNEDDDDEDDDNDDDDDDDNDDGDYNDDCQAEEDEPVKGKPSRPSYEPPAPAPAPPRNDTRHDHRSDPRSDPKYHLDEDQTPRVQRPASQAVKQSPYFGLQDAPSPSGRLSDRIQRLKQRCMDALGREAFSEAYRYLKLFEETHPVDSRFYEEEMEEEKVCKMRSILGEGKAHYMPLIEQLIFMEETHG